MYRYVIVLSFLLIGCSEFPTKYEVIENDKIRLLDFMYEPSDAAPGDTVKLKAVFAGRSVTADMIDWRVSCKVAVNEYGFDTAYEIQPLSCNPQQIHFSDQTSCIQILFVIPDSIMYKSPMLKNDWTAAMPSEYSALIPEEIRKLKRDQLLDTLAHLASLIKSANNEELSLIETILKDDFNFSDFAGLLQLFTVKMKIFADVKGSHTIEDDYTVRYNRVFNRLSSVFRVNTNPVIDSVILYKVDKKGLIRFNPADRYQRYKLYSVPSDTETVIPVDTSCTYFLRSFTSNIDTSLTLEDLQSTGEYGLETHRRVFMYQHDFNESDKISSKDYMDILATDADTMAILIPPSHPDLKKFTLWLRVYDEFYNESYRKDASVLKEYRGRFQY
jgi:hypothetical protein